MPKEFWDYIHLGRTRSDREEHHNLQQGLFQIASQTCNILVQVNNTNNVIHYNNYAPSTSGDFQDFHSGPSTSGSIRKSTSYDLEQSVVLLDTKKHNSPQKPSTPRFHRLSEYRRRLSVRINNNFIQNAYYKTSRLIHQRRNHSFYVIRFD